MMMMMMMVMMVITSPGQGLASGAAKQLGWYHLWPSDKVHPSLK
jgi:hypothetical protein